MNNNSRPIGVFDSGVGGLSVYQELKRQLPNENFVYLADQKNAPYGGKSPSEIRKLTLKCLNFLLSPRLPKFPRSPQTPFPSPKLIIIACNTSTVSGIDFYREQLPGTPIIGVVPVVKTANEVTKNGRVAILSTVATASSKYQKDLISKFCPNFQVINLVSPNYPNFPDSPKLPAELVLNVGCPNLVSFIESGITSGKEIEKELTEILKPVLDARCDTLVLGCTHYPFLLTSLKKIFSKFNIEVINNPQQEKLETRNSKLEKKSQKKILKNSNLKIVSDFEFRSSNFINILDSSGAITRQTKHILEKNNLLNLPPKPPTASYPSSLFLTTGSSKKFQEVIKKLINEEVQVTFTSS